MRRRFGFGPNFVPFWGGLSGVGIFESRFRGQFFFQPKFLFDSLAGDWSGSRRVGGTGHSPYYFNMAKGVFKRLLSQFSRVVNSFFNPNSLWIRWLEINQGPVGSVVRDTPVLFLPTIRDRDGGNRDGVVT